MHKVYIEERLKDFLRGFGNGKDIKKRGVALKPKR